MTRRRPARLAAVTAAWLLLVVHSASASTATTTSSPVAEPKSFSAEVQDWAPVAGVLVTAGAVAVALFGPAWRERRRRPVVRLDIDHEATGWTEESSSPSVLWLLVSNKRGRDTAQDVEVFLSVGAQLPYSYDEERPMFHHAADEEALDFEDPTSVRPPSPRASVPAGFSRRVAFAVTGNPGPVASALQTAGRDATRPEEDEQAPVPVARLAIATPRQPAALWLEFGITYEVEFVVTGSNFDAVRFRGQVGSREAPDLREDEGDERTWASVGWVRRPSSYKPKPGDRGVLDPPDEEPEEPRPQ